MYRNNPTWGETVKSLTIDGQGVDNIIEVGGVGTLHQSVKAVKLEGIISVVGSVSGGKSSTIPSILDCWLSTYTARGVAVGSRAMMEEMVAGVEANDIHPILDDRSFSLAQARDAFIHFVSLSSPERLTFADDPSLFSSQAVPTLAKPLSTLTDVKCWEHRSHRIRKPVSVTLSHV